MVVNTENKVALKYYQPIQKFVTQVPSGCDGYVFVVRANIALSFVDQQDVENIMNRKKVKGCCPGSRNAPAFNFASEDDVRRWENNGGR